MKKIKILLADDHLIFLDGLHVLLKNESEFEVVGKATDGEEAQQIILSEKIDIALLDIRMPKIDGIDLSKIIYKKSPSTKVILLTMLDDAFYIAKAYNKGIHGYVLKEKSTETLIKAIYAVYRGNSYWPNEFIELIRNENLKKQAMNEEVTLTIREKEILCLLAEEPGLSYKEIGERLHIAEFTVQTHFQNSRKKLGMKTKGELVKFAIENGLCDGLE